MYIKSRAMVIFGGIFWGVMALGFLCLTALSVWVTPSAPNACIFGVGFVFAILNGHRWYAREYKSYAATSSYRKLRALIVSNLQAVARDGEYAVCDDNSARVVFAGQMSNGKDSFFRVQLTEGNVSPDLESDQTVSIGHTVFFFMENSSWPIFKVYDASLIRPDEIIWSIRPNDRQAFIASTIEGFLTSPDELKYATMDELALIESALRNWTRVPFPDSSDE